MPANISRAKQIRQDSLAQFLSAFGMSEDKTKRALELQQQAESARTVPRVVESGNRSGGPHSPDPAGDRKVPTSHEESEESEHEQSSSTRPPPRGP